MPERTGSEMTEESVNNDESRNQILEKMLKARAILDTYINLFDIMTVTCTSKAKEGITTVL